MRNQIPKSFRRVLAISGGAGLLLALAVFDLQAQQKEPTAGQSLCPTSASHKSESAVADALLPTIPPEVSENAPSIMTSSGIWGPIPGELPPDPDNPKNLYGYDGPYYNTSELDGQVKVVDQSIYLWPTSTWKVSGMLRNQTRCPIQIKGLTARLLGANGEILATATAVPSVAELRPGEPGPFTVEASIPREQVKSVNWHADYALGSETFRLFELQVNRQEIQPGPNFYFRATIRNAATTTVRDVHVVVGFLSIQDNRLLYVTTAKFGFDSASKELKDTIDLLAGGSDEVVYMTSDPKIVQLIGASRVALWGISQ